MPQIQATNDKCNVTVTLRNALEEVVEEVEVEKTTTTKPPSPKDEKTKEENHSSCCCEPVIDFYEKNFQLRMWEYGVNNNYVLTGWEKLNPTCKDGVGGRS